MDKRMKLLSFEAQMARDDRLLQAIKRRLPELEELQRELDIATEKAVYRFYHLSAKVYGYQYHTGQVVSLIHEIADELGRPLNEYFLAVINAGTGREFNAKGDEDWAEHARPILEALFHAHYFVTMMVKYGRQLEVAQQWLPDGWAALLELFEQRGGYELV